MIGYLRHLVADVDRSKDDFVEVESLKIFRRVSSNLFRSSYIDLVVKYHQGVNRMREYPTCQSDMVIKLMNDIEAKLIDLADRAVVLWPNIGRLVDRAVARHGHKWPSDAYELKRVEASDREHDYAHSHGLDRD
jgi:hypothetical protein